LDEKNEQAPEHQVVHDSMGRDPDQRRAVVIGHELHARGERAVDVHRRDGGLDARYDIVGVLGAPHDDDGGDHVILMIAARDAESRHEPDVYSRNVLDQHGNAVELPEHDVLNVIDVIALREIIVPAVVDQSHAADVHRLLADGDLAAAHIDVGVAERGQKLRHRDVIRLEFVEIGLDFEFLCGSAPAVDRNHTLDRRQAPQRDPVLHGAQVGEPEVLGADDLVTVDLADQARLLDLRHLVRGELHVLLQAELGLRVGEVVVDPVLEGHAHERQAVERGRADVVDPRRPV
jgi:hypothetical protein